MAIIRTAILSLSYLVVTIQHTKWTVNDVTKKDPLERPRGVLQQGMNYCIKFTILYKDCLVMKKIGKRPITEADTDFFPYLLLEESYALGIAVSGQICLRIFILLL